jgi:hypothetical protein
MVQFLENFLKPKLKLVEMVYCSSVPYYFFETKTKLINGVYYGLVQFKPKLNPFQCDIGLVQFKLCLDMV